MGKKVKMNVNKVMEGEAMTDKERINELEETVKQITQKMQWRDQEIWKELNEFATNMLIGEVGIGIIIIILLIQWGC